MGNSRIFVTGATGFIGQCLVQSLRDNGEDRVAANRQQPAPFMVPVFQFARNRSRQGCKTAVTQRLCGSLQVDISHTRNTLNWTPPVSVDDGFRAAASAFLNE